MLLPQAMWKWMSFEHAIVKLHLQIRVYFKFALCKNRKQGETWENLTLQMYFKTSLNKGEQDL